MFSQPPKALASLLATLGLLACPLCLAGQTYSATFYQGDSSAQVSTDAIQQSQFGGDDGRLGQGLTAWFGKTFGGDRKAAQAPSKLRYFTDSRGDSVQFKAELRF